MTDPKSEQKPFEPSREKALVARMARIKHKILILSGKGGVGKSTVAANLAVALQLAGRRVGLLDVDFHGPSIPKLLGIEDGSIGPGDSIVPVTFGDGLKVMSMGFLLRGADDAVVWRGPLKMKVIQQFLQDVAWGDLDDLVIDFPPGTGDEPLSVAQLIPDATGAVVVTTPQELALADVRRCIDFCRKLGIPVMGLIENMSGFVCPNCGETVDIFKRGGGEVMARKVGIPYLGRVPIDPKVVEMSDAGQPVVLAAPHSETTKAFLRIVRPILEMQTTSVEPSPMERENGKTRIALPLANGRLAMHFGHCQEFALVDVDVETNKIVGQTTEAAPSHEPGLLPKWLAEHGVNVIIAGGMGSRAQSLFVQQDIEVVVGAPSLEAEVLVKQYIDGGLASGENICDH